MNFAELRFWGYLLAGLLTLAVFRPWLTRGRDDAAALYDKSGLALLGLLLLLAVSWLTCVIYLGVTLVTYAGLHWIRRYHPHHALKYLLILIPLQLAPLFYFKYAHFVVNEVFGGAVDGLRGLVIPVGISFYSFQLVGFAVDTLALNKPLPRALDCLNFAGFFPQIVAGPIERREDLLPQMAAFRFRWDPACLRDGAAWIVLGLYLKCCLADNLATYFDRGPSANAYLVWLANLTFGLRIYFDFAGYSIVAIGLGRALGIRLTLNFTSPYCSRNAVEFWRRWHITLSQWFRDYVYLPLGGGRVRYWAANVTLVFVVSGIWHGAGWNFILWGALHAAFLMINRWLGPRSLPTPVAWLTTMVAVFLSWLCFYELDPRVLLTKLLTLVTPAAYALPRLREAAAHLAAGDQIVLASLLVLTGATLAAEWLSIRWRNEPYHYLRRPGVQVALVVLTVLLAPGKYNDFIYFAF